MNEQAKQLIKDHYDFDDLVALMNLLRSPDGCAWDRAQTHESIRKNLLEECCEVLEGIDNRDPKLLCEELGDLLLQILFHAKMSEEQGEFSIDDVVDGICKKMVSRHPHVFADQDASDPDSAYRHWEEIKAKEKKDETLSSSMNRIARTLPSLMRTQKLIKKAQQAGVERQGEIRTAQELKTEYLTLCRNAQTSGIDLEELGYFANEEYIREKTGADKNENR